jgi:membrane-associated HD superfamily phosphohydrolase
MESDGLANTVCYNDVAFLTHTWYARNYNKDPENTKRIDGYLPKLSNEGRLKTNPIIFKNKYFILKRPYRILKDLINQVKQKFLEKK